ncbi:DinB family protein [Streptomyces sp. NRRL F-2664]|uniref:DinB family protein n=1 Tax=Streptomyces sp. NRRL F-2664 TaxID=1463842 RepID=UPI0004C87858|nr:DinB family protein [Streptomyces sp. NRRL F-2664]
MDGPAGPAFDGQAAHAELERVRAEFHQLLGSATRAELARPSAGTRWTNEQLLFHMLFGYALIRPLLVVFALFGRLPLGASGAFARLLNAVTTAFDLVNYLGPVGGAGVCGRRRMLQLFDRVIADLHRRIDAESPVHLALRMYYPTRWDPLFMDVMTVADLYRYPARHFDFHRRQLTLPAPGQG